MSFSNVIDRQAGEELPQMRSLKFWNQCTYDLNNNNVGGVEECTIIIGLDMNGD